MLVTQGTGFLQVILVGDDNTGLTLDGLDQEGSQIRASGLKCLTKGGLVIVGDGLLGAGDGASDTGEVRAIVLAGLWVRG